MKGLKVAKRANESSDGKLAVSFSSKFGGPIDIHYREFVDEIAHQTRSLVPVIGVNKWSDVPLETKNTIIDKVLDRWSVPDDDVTRSKILRIAQERYKGWRATLSATYKAYKDDEEKLIQNMPEELDPEEWNSLMSYFESDEFKRVSSRNSENRKKLVNQHHMGSKSLSQISFENRDPVTQEEPSDLVLWELSYCLNGQWSGDDKKRIYDEAKQRIAEIESEECRTLSKDERDAIFQSISNKKSGYIRGRGYMAKPTTCTERIRDELNSEIQELKRQLDLEKGERETERIERDAAIAAALETERSKTDKEIESIKQTMRQEFMTLLANHSKDGN